MAPWSHCDPHHAPPYVNDDIFHALKVQNTSNVDLTTDSIATAHMEPGSVLPLLDSPTTSKHGDNVDRSHHEDHEDHSSVSVAQINESQEKSLHNADDEDSKGFFLFFCSYFFLSFAVSIISSVHISNFTFLRYISLLYADHNAIKFTDPKKYAFYRPKMLCISQAQIVRWQLDRYRWWRSRSTTLSLRTI